MTSVMSLRRQEYQTDTTQQPNLSQQTVPPQQPNSSINKFQKQTTSWTRWMAPVMSLRRQECQSDAAQQQTTPASTNITNPKAKLPH